MTESSGRYTKLGAIPKLRPLHYGQIECVQWNVSGRS